MLKRSLIVVAVLGAFVGAAGANTESEPEKVSLEQQYDELDFDMPAASCTAELPEEIRSQADLEKLIELQAEEGEGQSLYAYSWGTRTRYCCIPFYGRCLMVRC